jgi:hypothetical protein
MKSQTQPIWLWMRFYIVKPRHILIKSILYDPLHIRRFYGHSGASPQKSKGAEIPRPFSFINT